MSRQQKVLAIKPNNPKISIARQCQLMRISTSTYYYKCKGFSSQTLAIMRIIDELYLASPTSGSRTISLKLRRLGYKVGRKYARSLMRKMGLYAIYTEPKTTIANKEHKVYPYLLRGLTIQKPNQVWCTDITYIPLKQGFVYLVAVMDWYSRKVLSWRISNTMDARFCVEALKDAMRKYGKPKIFNTDQGSQFTSKEFTDVLKDADIKISMDGRRRWIDNVFIERLWRSLKYECVYLNAFEIGRQAREGIGRWLDYYNHDRPHSTFDGHTPHETYNGIVNSNLAA